MRKILPFEKAIYLTKIDRKVEGDTITRQNQVIETKTKMFDFKITRVAIQKVVPTQGQFLSNLFLVEKKDGGKHPVINLKNLNKFIPYEHFKMEGLHCLKLLLEQDDWL